MLSHLIRLLLCILAITITGCGSHVWHYVQKGDTLYSISFRYGQDYKQVAQWNDISSPYIISPGQRLRVVAPVVTANDQIVTTRAVDQPEKRVVEINDSKPMSTRPETVKTAKPAKPVTKLITVKPEQKIIVTRPPPPKYPTRITWHWPVNGKIIEKFSARQPGSKGIDIAGSQGVTIKAAASGRVVYAGEGLVSYGRLIIIKNNEQFLSAYAHNQTLLVSEGDDVKAGQTIATMGNSGTDRVKLHFEIRKKGKPVNPLKYLPKR